MAAKLQSGPGVLLGVAAHRRPVISLLSEHVALAAWRSSGGPPQNMKALGTAVLHGGKWVPDGRVFCVHVCVRVSHHIRERFYSTSGLTALPGVMWGRLAQDGEGTRAERRLDANVRPGAAGVCDCDPITPHRDRDRGRGRGRGLSNLGLDRSPSERRVAQDQCGLRAIDHSGAKACFQDPPSSSSSMISMFESSQRPPDSGNLRKRTV